MLSVPHITIVFELHLKACCLGIELHLKAGSLGIEALLRKPPFFGELGTQPIHCVYRTLPYAVKSTCGQYQCGNDLIHVRDLT
jgi:hypothetical protein